MNLWSNKIKFCKQVQNNIFYNLDIQNCNVNYWNKINTNKEGRNRVVCCVYGTYKDIMNYMNKSDLNVQNEDNIIGIWACKKLDVLNIIENI